MAVVGEIDAHIDCCGRSSGTHEVLVAEFARESNEGKFQTHAVHETGVENKAGFGRAVLP
jgi:hypothetical protein